MGRKFEPIIPGQIICDMEVIDEFRDEKNNRRMLKCMCTKCNRVHNIYEGNLRNNPSVYNHEEHCSRGINTLDKNFANTFACIKQRMTNPNNDKYHEYGGRGLELGYTCLVDFFDDQYPKYLIAKQANPDEKVSVDRINNDLGYIPGNLRWVTQITQTRNSRRVYEFIAIAPDGTRYLSNNQLAFAAKHGLESRYISDCIRGVKPMTAGWRFVRLDDFRKGPNLFYFDYHNDPFTIKELYY